MGIAERGERCLQILWVLACEFKLFASSWVLKGKFYRMEPLPFQAKLLGQFGVRAIQIIPHKRVVKMGEVNSNLMSSSSFQTYFHEGCRWQHL